MATNSLQSLHHHHHHHNILKLHPSDTTTTTPPSSVFLKPTTTATTTINTNCLSFSSFSSTTTFSTSPTTSTTTPSTSQAFSLDLLQHHLSTQNFRQADEETRRLLILLAGEQAQKRGYVFFSEAQFISAQDLKAIDELWTLHSNNRFGYSVQKRIWQQKASKDFTKFFLKVGWMKKLDTEVEQYNYRSFPNEFTWELNDETPEGHLPLTNALRGTQLLCSILSHPAFDQAEQEQEQEQEDVTIGGENGGNGLEDKDSSSSSSSTSLSKRVFKPDYSF